MNNRKGQQNEKYTFSVLTNYNENNSDCATLVVLNERPQKAKNKAVGLSVLVNRCALPGTRK